jgi:peptidoglycan/xylan/chitin deacetylase (PgdA/CDA1 family)
MDTARSDAYPPGYYEDDPLPDKTVYLTFDDGPSDWTAGILDILKKERVKATFFICADWAPRTDRTNNDFKKYRDVLLRMMAEGHVVGNHTVDHANLAALTPDRIARELDENQEIFDRELASGARRMLFIRPPFGSPWLQAAPDAVRAKVGAVIRPRGILVMWSRHFDSSDSMEWVRGEWYEKGPRIYMGDEAFRIKMHRIYRRLISRATGRGVVILFHDTHPTTMDILPAVIENLKKGGYRFDSMEGFVRWRWKKSSSELIGTPPAH